MHHIDSSDCHSPSCKKKITGKSRRFFAFSKALRAVKTRPFANYSRIQAKGMIRARLRRERAFELQRQQYQYYIEDYPECTIGAFN